MFLINFKKNFIKTIILSFLMILFSVLIITLNFNNNNISYNDYLNLPFYFKLIFLIFIPIFNEYNYLFSFIMFYFLIIIIIYSIYLARVKYYNIISPENIYKTEIKALLSRYLHIVILIFSTFLSNEVKLNGQISRDANIYCVSISFGNDNEEIISGNLNYSSENEQSIPDGVVGGETKYTAIETNTENIILSIIKSILSSLIFSFIIIMLLLWIAPKFKDKASEIVKNNSFKAFGIGLLVLFGIIIAAFMLLLFTYGLAASIAVVGIVLLALAYVVSNTIFSMSIGKLIANKLNLSKNVAFVLFSLLIVLILGLIKYIPYVGGPINFITSIIGLGIISINAFKRKDLTISKKIESES